MSELKPSSVNFKYDTTLQAYIFSRCLPVSIHSLGTDFLSSLCTQAVIQTLPFPISLLISAVYLLSQTVNAYG